MRITKQPSGGRGELELSEIAPNGLAPIDLVRVPIKVLIGKYLIHTEVQTTTQGGKYRIRRLNNTIPQIHIQIVSVLMMPTPIRDEGKLVGGEPVLQSNAYLIKNINFGEVSYDRSSPDIFCVAEIQTLDCANNTIAALQVPVQQRMALVERVWQTKNRLPTEMSALIAEHEMHVRSGKPIPKRVTEIINSLQAQMATLGNEVSISCTRTTDVLPALVDFLDIPIDRPTPIPLDQIDPDAMELRRREIKKWHWQAQRGYRGLEFRKAIRDAYNCRCIMCGHSFPSTTVSQNPGIDAAHILPWAEFDLDKIFNGIALCKLHHWAFDEGILRLGYKDGEYFIEIEDETLDVLSGAEFSVDVLREVVGVVPLDRLPAKPEDWPHPDLLKHYYEAFH